MQSMEIFLLGRQGRTPRDPRDEQVKSHQTTWLSPFGVPGAHHTRFEHSLGVSHVGGLMSDAVGLEDFEKDVIQVAGMLHDVGHGPIHILLSTSYRAEGEKIT